MCILEYVEFYIEQSTFFRSLKEHPEHVRNIQTIHAEGIEILQPSVIMGHL